MANESYVVKRRPGEAGLWQSKRPRLGRLDMELTERCNLDCVHCYINQPANDAEVKAQEMSTQQVKAILDEAAELGCLTVRFTGGEPLLREDFEELYLHARRLGLRVLLFTNATLITPAVADLLARVPPLEKIEITVYGMTPESYEAVTGVRGAYRAAMRGINLLLERGVPFVVKGALLPPNEHEMEAFEEWAATIPWMDKPPSYAMFFDLRARRDRPEKGRQIEELRRRPAAGVEVLAREPERYRDSMAEFCGKFMGPPGEALFRCGAGRGGCVDAYGRMQACMLLRDPATVYDLTPPPTPPRRRGGELLPTGPAGGEGEKLPPPPPDPSTGLGGDSVAERDLLPPSPPEFGGRRGAGGDEGGLHHALTDFFPRLRELRAANPDYLARCARCFLKGLCEQCPARAWMEHGTLDTPVEYLCQVAHAQARELGLLGEDEHGWEVVDWRERVERLRGRET